MENNPADNLCHSMAQESNLFSQIQEPSSVHENGLESLPQATPSLRPSETLPATDAASSSTLATPDPREGNKSPTKTKGRLRRRSEIHSIVESDIVEKALEPLTDEERRNWPGWVELESDPGLFDWILRKYGVKDVKVQEVLDFDSTLLDMLPQPVYGLIFLLKYRDDIGVAKGVPKCPSYVWFANQTINNACATVALLNIVMNVPDIDLGEALSTFKAETNHLKPPYRGKLLGSNSFIRSIHNSFARRMDILNEDLSLINDMKKREKAKNTKRKSTRKIKDDEDELGFHFLAYVPINGAVWKLDGLQRQPDNLGDCHQDNWMSVAIDDIKQHIEEYQQDGVQFNLLSLCRSPLCSIPEKIATSIHTLSSIRKFLVKLQPDWQQFSPIDELSLASGSATLFGVTPELLREFTLSEAVNQRIEEAAMDPTALMNMYVEYATNQIQLQALYMDEDALIDQENEQAEKRKQDHTSLVYNAFKTLAEKGILKEIVKEVSA